MTQSMQTCSARTPSKYSVYMQPTYTPVEASSTGSRTWVSVVRTSCNPQ